ncbi:MAG TPA: alpha/beta hydrolase, partial [Pilimelia sp.]|nr:alpha/beta hydrolase [Pilimelia sp.]
MRSVRTAYGAHPDQFVELTLPPGAGPVPVVVVLHGGFWRAAHGVELARPLAADLAAAGFAAVADEYRPDGAGGGWPAT